MTRCFRLPAPRGTITDRHDVPVALDAADAGVGVDRASSSPPCCARGPPTSTGSPCSSAGRPRTCTRSSPPPRGRRCRCPWPTSRARSPTRSNAAAIEGVFVVAQPRRTYPQGALLGPVLGFVGVATPEDEQRWPGLPAGEFVGRAGLEQEYDAVLRGINGRQCLFVDPVGVPVALGELRPPVRGADLRLSIDLGLQRRLDAGLGPRGAQPRPSGKIGAAVAMDPRNGQVLAIASTPSFDNNVYGPPVDGAALQGCSACPARRCSST